MTPLEYDRAFIWHPYASLKDAPPVRMARAASGVEIELEDGRRLVDAVSSWWCVAHGHNHPAIVEAIRRQSEKMCHVMFGGFTHEPAVVLAEKLASFAPPGLDRVFFADSGFSRYPNRTNTLYNDKGCLLYPFSVHSFPYNSQMLILGFLR